MTLEGRTVLKEGWLTLFKSKKMGLFNSKPAPNKMLERGWAAVPNLINPSKLPSISFYMDNRKEKSVMKREKIDLGSVRGISRLFNHPKHPHSFSLKLKGSRKLILNADSENEMEAWLRVLCDITGMDYKREKVIWEYYDGGLWNALADENSFVIEGHYCDGVSTFQLEDSQMLFRYDIGHMSRIHLRTRATHRIKRTPFTEDRPEVVHRKMLDLPALWEWGDDTTNQWHPFERETTIQIENMYDSGSQWAELTLCLPSPMPFLLDLHDMKLVNFRTAVRYSLRRLDNSDNIQPASMCPQPRSPSPDDFDEPPQPNMMSPMSPMFKPIQDCITHLQVPRRNITISNMLGEGAFGEVFLASVVGLPGFGSNPAEVAVKQLRLSDFIARHGHHTQQMEDFLREAKEMSKVNHHRVVKLIAVCTLDYPMLLIEEFMDQGDLLGVLKDSRPHMPLLTQLTFSQHVADGMDYISTILSCVHRDLAARNILVNRSNDGSMHAKVADFGLSRHLYSEMYKTQGSKPRPLPAKWMALESLMYFIFTSKSDVWSFGVILWEVMTLGRSPYPGVENRELLEQIEEMGLKLTRPKPCPGPIYEMILDCTKHKAADRPTFAELRTRIEVCLEQLEKGELEDSNSGDAMVTTPPDTETTPSKSTPEDKLEVKKEGKSADDGEKEKMSTPSKKPAEPPRGRMEHMYSIIDDRDRKKSSKNKMSTSNSESSETPPTPARPTSSPKEKKNVVVNGTSPVHAPIQKKESTSNREITQQGHLYYLLDPQEEPTQPHPSSPANPSSPAHPQSNKASFSAPLLPPPPPPPPPNHDPPSSNSSPAHVSNHHTPHDSDDDDHLMREHSSPVLTSRPKAYSVASEPTVRDNADAKRKGKSLNRPKSNS